MMKRLCALILFVCIAAAPCVTTATADDYVDDVYFWQPAKPKTAKPDKTASEQKQPATVTKSQQQSTAGAKGSSAKTTAKPEKFRFVQVSDTVVKAVIRR